MLEQEDILNAIRKSFERFGQLDLLAKLAGLQLVPANAGCSLRLEALTHACASLKPQAGKPNIGTRRLRQLCTDQNLANSQIGLSEDPCDNMFTEAFTFFGGSFIVFPGIIDEPIFILRNLSKALFLAQHKILNSAFLNQSYEAFLVILALSDAIASRTGLGRGVEPVDDFKGLVSVPDSTNLRRLADAVSFEGSELRSLLADWQLGWSSIEPFVLDMGSFTPRDYTIYEAPLHRKPLARYKDHFVVAEPGCLLAALRHRIVSLAIQYGVIDELATGFRTAVWDNTLTNLEHLTLDQLGFPSVENVPFHDGLFFLDTDKALYVQLATDDLRDYSTDTIFGLWQNPTIIRTLEHRQREVEELVFASQPAPNEMLVLTLFQGVGRAVMFGIGEPLEPCRSDRLLLTAADLETISLLEAGDPLVLLKYARAQERIRQHTKILPASQLDEFHLYRARDYSYYLSDERKPNMISILPGGAGELRRKAYTQRDRHGVRAYRAGSFVEVHCLHDRDVPIYIPFSDIGNRVSVLVEGLPILIWLIGPVYADANEWRLHSYYAEFADMISYWLWQMTPSLVKYFEGVQVPTHPMVIYLDIPVDEAWFSSLSINAITTPPEKAVPLTNLIDGEFGIRLVIGVECMKGMTGPDNKGERAFMGEVLHGLRLLLDRFNAPRANQLDRDAIEAIIERHAPLGMKKKLLFLNIGVKAELDPTNIPSFRKVQHADANCLLDELGAYLLSCGYEIGDIPDADRVKTLRKAVEYLYSRMESLVATLDPRQLLDWLIAYNEAFVQDMWFTRLTIPTRVACFGNKAGLVTELMSHIGEVYTASLANRFLIEYAASQPPSGMRPMSLDLYDQLMAIASEIVNWGFISDLLYYKIFDEKLSILPSERLGINREPFMKARSLFMSEHAERQVESATRAFEKFWTPGEPNLEESDRKEVEEINTTFENEFGATLTQLATFVRDLYRLGMNDPNPAKTFEYQELVDALCNSLGWDKRKVEGTVDLMAIRPRNDFMRPPLPFREADVYPWVFNRRLSHMRRPLLIQSIGGSTRVRWGNRRLLNSFEHLVGLCLSGHLKGESPEITRLMTRFRNEASDAFNEEVAKIIRSYPQLMVKSKADKIQGHRIGSPGGDLGDIDVLVVFPAKRKVLLVETKKLALAGTPREISNELNELFRGTKTKRSTVEKHKRREDWVKTNIDKVLAHFGFSLNGSWQVESIIVLDNEAFSRHLFPSPIPVVVFPGLEKDFLSKWCA